MTATQFKSLKLPKDNGDAIKDYLNERNVPVLTTGEGNPPQEPGLDHPTTEMKPLPVRAPHYLAKALRKEAAEQGCTINYLVLNALKNGKRN